MVNRGGRTIIEVSQETMGKMEKLPPRYIDNVPYLIYERKIECPACRNSYKTPITISHDGQTECISICPKCRKKFQIPYDKEVVEILRKRLKNYSCDSIEDLRQYFKKNEGWKKKFYPEFFWEEYERYILPFQKTPEEQHIILQKHDEEARQRIDYEDVLVSYYYKGNIDNPMVIQTRGGKAYLLKGETIIEERNRYWCSLDRCKDNWELYIILRKKDLIPLHWDDENLLQYSRVIYCPHNHGSLFKTNLRLIHLAYSTHKGEGPYYPGLDPLTNNNWTASFNREALSRKDGFSIPLKYIVGYIKKRKKCEVYFKNKNNEKFRVDMWQEDSNYDLLKDFPIVHSRKELSLD